MTRAPTSDAMAPAGRRDMVGRAFDPSSDMAAMVDLIAEVNTFDRVDWIPTVEQLEVDWAPRPGFDPPRDTRLVEEAGRPVGAAQHTWRQRDRHVVHSIEVWVRPAARRRGIGRRLLDWAESRAREAVGAGAGGSRDLPHVLSMDTGVHVPAGMAFAEASGYVPVRYFFVMHRDLGQPIDDVPMPQGLETRPVTPDQHRRIWDADEEAFRDHWEASVRGEADFVRFFDNPDIDTSMWQVAWDGDEVAGSVVNGIYPGENAALGVEIGWLDHVSVRRPWRGRGLAGALIARSLRVLRDRGMAFAALGVDAENPTGALAVYERQGFKVHQTFARLRKPL
jgi:mycothiol synthase